MLDQYRRRVDSSHSVGRPRLGRESLLPPIDGVPGTKLPPGIGERADVHEAELAMQRDTSVVWHRDARHRGAKAAPRAIIEQLAIQRSTDAAAARSIGDVEPDLGRPLIRRALAPR